MASWASELGSRSSVCPDAAPFSAILLRERCLAPAPAPTTAMRCVIRFRNSAQEEAEMPTLDVRSRDDGVLNVAERLLGEAPSRQAGLHQRPGPCAGAPPLFPLRKPAAVCQTDVFCGRQPEQGKNTGYGSLRKCAAPTSALPRFRSPWAQLPKYWSRLVRGPYHKHVLPAPLLETVLGGDALGDVSLRASWVPPFFLQRFFRALPLSRVAGRYLESDE